MKGAMLALFALMFIASAAGAQTLIIEDGWIRATPPNAKVSAGYMAITNTGETADRLVSVTSDFAHKNEIHETVMVDGVMKMRPFENGIVIGAGETIMLQPKSSHLMFMGLKQPMQKGDSHIITLMFEQAGKITVTIPVLTKQGDTAQSHGSHSSHSHSHNHSSTHSHSH